MSAVSWAMRASMAVAVLCGSGMLAAISCGGTTGREGLTTGSDSGAGDAASDAGSAEGAGGRDATVPAEGSADFDVVIQYADRTLPDVGAPLEAGAAGDGAVGYPWPSCPPFFPVIAGKNGKPARASDLTNATDELPTGYDDAGNVVPAVYDDAGSVVPAIYPGVYDDAGNAVAAHTEGGAILPLPSGSAFPGRVCATYGWLGSTSVDECVTANSLDTLVWLPPCNWCGSDAGNAASGPLAGTSRVTLCENLYSCIRRTGCVAQGAEEGGAFDVLHCLCGNVAPADCVAAGGPCGPEELAALEYDNTKDGIIAAIANFVSQDPMFPGVCGSTLNQLFTTALAQLSRPSGCFPPDAGPF